MVVYSLFRMLPFQSKHCKMSLADFVKEQRSKAASSTSFSMANLGSKVSTSFNGFFRTDITDDTECLTDSPSTDGQLPSARNRLL